MYYIPNRDVSHPSCSSRGDDEPRQLEAGRLDRESGDVRPERSLKSDHRVDQLPL